MSSNNPIKNLFANLLDKYSSPIITDAILPETREGCPHYENRARYFIDKDGSYQGISKDNFKNCFGKEYTPKKTYDKQTNSGTGSTLQKAMHSEFDE